MTISLFSESWYRVSALRPLLRRHAQVHHHLYRGEEWYVLEDHSTGNSHRFSKEAYYIIGLMDGKNSLRDIWETACGNLGDDMPTQDEVIRLLSQLHQADLLQADIPPDIREMYERNKRYRKNSLVSRFKSPLSIKIPFIDPEQFLDKTMFIVRPIFSFAGLLLYIVLLLIAISLAAFNWTELTMNLADRVLALENMFILWLIYPVIKAVHEFSHAYTVKHYGGEVHDMGIMLLVFVPVPYVDASASSAFREKYQRVMVGASGIMAELMLASIAMLIWVNAEPGLIRAVAFNVMIVSGVSTILFNGNPLLRFDAYYILSDFIEIPNLAARSASYIGYLLKRYLLKMDDAVSPVTAKGEAAWFLLYGISSFIYRMFITIRIALFIAGRFFFIGVALAIWGISGILVMPLIRILKFLFIDPAMQRKKMGAVTITILSIMLIALSLFIIPFPSSTVSMGVLWPPENSRLYAGADGYIKKIVSQSGAKVKKGEPLVICLNNDLLAQKKELDAIQREYEVRYSLAETRDRTEARILKDEIWRISSELNNLDEQIANLTIKSPSDGIFLLPDQESMVGLYLRRGTQIGYVVDFKGVTVKIVVAQKDINSIRTRTEAVEVMTMQNPGRAYPGLILRETPAASTELPSLALSLEGGGEHALNPLDDKKVNAFENLFHLEVAIDIPEIFTIGEKVFVRFRHGTEPLFIRIYHGIRRTFLSKFNI
ncbi:MAG: peptidase M50 [Desulfatiglans sp.]|nr:peptidase M50 [Desulfatiglans sp.]